jgi:hypothetical protein
MGMRAPGHSQFNYRDIVHDREMFRRQLILATNFCQPAALVHLHDQSSVTPMIRVSGLTVPLCTDIQD